MQTNKKKGEIKMKKNKFSLVMTVLLGTLMFASITFAATDNILSANIKEADGTSGQNTNAGSGVKTDHIQDGAVTGNKVAAGAITDSKIAGPISASKIESAGVDADTGAGKQAEDLT